MIPRKGRKRSQDKKKDVICRMGRTDIPRYKKKRWEMQYRTAIFTFTNKKL